MEGRHKNLYETISTNVSIVCESDDVELCKRAIKDLFEIAKQIKKLKTSEAKMFLKLSTHYTCQESIDVNLAIDFYLIALKILNQNRSNLQTAGLRVRFNKLVELVQPTSTSHAIFAISYCYFNEWGTERDIAHAKKYYYMALQQLWHEWQTQSLCGAALFQKLLRLESFGQYNMGFECRDGFYFSENDCNEAPLILATMKAIVAQLKGLLFAFQGNILSYTKNKFLFSASPLDTINAKLSAIHKANAKDIFRIALEVLALEKKFPKLQKAFQPLVEFDVKTFALDQANDKSTDTSTSGKDDIKLNLKFLSTSAIKTSRAEVEPVAEITITAGMTPPRKNNMGK